MRRLGPLSRSEAIELAASLPALSRLEPRDIDRAWRLAGGHPGVMGYLDAVLTASSFEDVAARCGPLPDQPAELPPAQAEAVAAAAGDLLLGELFGRLTPSAQALLIGASVYRVPVGCTVPLLPAGQYRRAAELDSLAAEATALVAAGADGLFSPASRPAPEASRPSGAAASQTAAWMASQVSRSAVVACDPAMCSALQAHGVAAGNLLAVRRGTADPRSADVVVATPVVRGQFGSRLASVYAPGVIASFGSGGTRIEVRAVAPDGAAAYLAGLASDLAARKQAGSELLRNPRITLPAAARGQLSAGRVDTRLMLMLTIMAATQPVRVVAFGDAGPGASPGMPLRGAELAVAGGGTSLRVMLAFARTQRPPYLPAQAAIVRGSVLSIQYAAPSPVGLLPAQPLT